MKFRSISFIALILAAIVLMPGAGAENQTMDTIYLLTHAETLAGQKDMSRFSNLTSPETPVTMNESTARLYLNVTWCGKDCMVPRSCSFPFTRSESPLTVMVVYNVNATEPDNPGPVVGYGLTGWPLQSPVFLSGSGIPNLNLLSGTRSGLFQPTGIVSVKRTSAASNPPPREFLDYMNAPAITREQKDIVLRIAMNSEKFQVYQNESHGPITFVWAYPYSGVVHMTMTVGSEMSPEYGLVSVDVNPDCGQVDNVSFTDWRKYW